MAAAEAIREVENVNPIGVSVVFADLSVILEGCVVLLPGAFAFHPREKQLHVEDPFRRVHPPQVVAPMLGLRVLVPLLVLLCWSCGATVALRREMNPQPRLRACFRVGLRRRPLLSVRPESPPALASMRSGRAAASTSSCGG